MNKVETIVQKVLKRSPKKVFIQVPEGLKTRLQEIQERLQKEDIQTIGSLEPCYGACDIKDREAKHLGCDLLLHIGHSKFCKEEGIKILYFPWYYEDLDPSSILEENFEELQDCEKIGLIAPINFKKALEKTRDYLEGVGKKCVTSKGGRTKEGQVLGCDVSSAKKIEDSVDCFLYIGSGQFHPLGLGFDTDKPLYILDFEQNKVYEPDFDLFKRQKHAAIERARGSDSFAILLSTKKCQSRPQKSEEIKRTLEKMNKKVWIFSMDEITPEKLQGIKADCIVNTACPRIAIDRRTDFDKPILNIGELRELIG